MTNSPLTPESDIETWTAVFLSSLEPREDFKDLLAKMINLMKSFLKGEKFSQKCQDYFFSETLPGAIKRIIHFQSISYSGSKAKVSEFFREATKFVNYSLQNNLEELYSPLISMFDSDSAVYQKNNNYIGEPFYFQNYRDYFSSDNAKNDASFFVDNPEVKITQFNFIFKIYSNNLKNKMKKYISNLSNIVINPFLEYINSIDNLHDVNTRALQDSLISFLDLTIDKTNHQLYIQLFNFLKKCLKSDMVEKQAIAAKTISNFCNIRNDILTLLNNNKIKESIQDFLDEATNEELNITVINLFIPFFELLCNPKVSLIDFNHICKLYDIASLSTDSEQQSPLFSFISNSIDGFEEPIRLNIGDYITRPPITSSTFKFLTKLTKNFWKIHQNTALGYVSLILCETERDQDAKEAVISIYKQNQIPIEARVLLVKEILKKISYNEESAEVAQTVLCTMIESSNSLRDIFTSKMNEEIIQKMNEVNKEFVFKIITKLFSKSAIFLTKEDSSLFSSLGTDDKLWTFYKDLIETNKLLHSDNIFNVIVDQANDQALSDQISKIFIEFLISLIAYENKSLFNAWKKKNSTLDGSPQHLEILFQAFLSSNDEKVTSIAENYLIQIFTTLKPIREIFYFIIEDKIKDESSLNNYNFLSIILNFIEISENEIDPEDFECPRHKYSSDFIILNCKKSDNFQFRIHIKPESKLSNLLHRIAIRNKCTKATSTKFMKVSDEKKSLFELGLKNYDDFMFSINYDSCDYNMPLSLQLMKEGFVIKLLSISNNDDFDYKFLNLIQKLLDILPTDESIKETELTRMNELIEKLNTENLSEIEKKYYLQSLLSVFKGNDEQDDENSELSFEFVKNDGIGVIIELLSQNNDPFYFEFMNEIFDQNEESFKPYVEIIISRFFDSIIENWSNLFSFDIFRNCFENFKEEVQNVIDQYQDKLYKSFNKVKPESWDAYSSCLQLDPKILFEISTEHLNDKRQTNLPFYVKLLSNSIKKTIEKYKENEKIEIEKDIYDSNLINHCCSMLNWKEVKPSIGDLVEIIFLITNNFTSKNKELKKITQDHEELLTSLIFDNSDPKTQKKLIDIIKVSYTDKTEQYLEKLFSNNKDIKDHWNYSPELFLRDSPYIGLRNLGATCFFNSIIQQFYHLFPVQYLMATHKFKKDSELTLLQSLFLQMHYSERKYCDTEPFIKQWHGWFKELINPREQHDAVEFFGFLIDDLPISIKKLFTGKQVNIITRKNGDLFHTDYEPFINLSVPIKGINNLEDSLQKLIVAEELQKQDDLTNKKITVLKSARVEEAPPILVIHLKRFEYLMKTYERKKLNDKFTFPYDLNIDKISQNPTNTNYKLVGIVVHSGTAIGGHYISFVRKNANKAESQWWKFNDIEVCQVSNEDVESAAYGSENQQSSAYVLFYIKEDFVLNLKEIEEDQENEHQEEDKKQENKDEIDEKHETEVEVKNVVEQLDRIELHDRNEEEHENEVVIDNSRDKNVDRIVSFFKELDYTEKVDIDFILNDNLAFRHTQSIFSEPIINFVLSIKKNVLLQLNYFINVLCHSQFDKQSKEFSEHLVKRINRHNKNKECLLYLFDKVHNVYENFLNISNDGIIDGLSDVVVCCSKEDISICIPILDLLKQNVYSFRQTPKVYEMIYKMIKNVIDNNNKSSNLIKIYKDFNNDKVDDDPFMTIFHKISEIITLAYTESRPQLFSNLNFTYLFNIIQELIMKLDSDKIDLSTITDFKSMISKSTYHYTAYNKMMNAFDSKRKKNSSSFFSFSIDHFTPSSTTSKSTTSKSTTSKSTSNNSIITSQNLNTVKKPQQKEPTYASPNRNKQPNIKQPVLILKEDTNQSRFNSNTKSSQTSNTSNSVIDDVIMGPTKSKEVMNLMRLLTSNKPSFLEEFKKFVQDGELIDLSSFYKSLIHDINTNHHSLRKSLITNSPKYFVEIFIKSEIEYRKETLEFYKKCFELLDESEKKQLSYNFSQYITTNDFKDNVNHTYNKFSQKMNEENSHLYQFLQFYEFMVENDIKNKLFNQSDAKTIFDTIQLIRKKQKEENDANIKILLMILGKFDLNYTNSYFQTVVSDIILDSKSTKYMEVLPLFLKRQREEESISIMRSEKFEKYVLLCWQNESMQDNINWQSRVKQQIYNSLTIFDSIYQKHRFKDKFKPKKLNDVLNKMKSEYKNTIQSNELGEYVTCFFETVQGKNPLNNDAANFSSYFVQIKKEIGKFNFDPQKISSLIKLSYPIKANIIEVLRHLFKYASSENDEVLFNLIDYQIADKFVDVQPSYFQDLIHFLMNRDKEETIKKIARSLHSHNTMTLLSKVYDIIKDSIQRKDHHSESFDQQWIENEIFSLGFLEISKNTNFFKEALKKFTDQQIIDLFKKLQNKDKYNAISCLVGFLNGEKRFDLIEEFKNLSKYNSLPSDKKFRGKEEEKELFMMIIKEIGSDDDTDDSVRIIDHKRK